MNKSKNKTNNTLKSVLNEQTKRYSKTKKD